MHLITVVPTSIPGWVDLRFAYSKPIVEKVKAIPGCAWNPEARCWAAPEHALPALATELGNAARFTVSLAAPRPAAPPVHPAFVANLRPYQLEGVQKMLAHFGGGFLLAYEQRVGKTRTASAAVASALASGAAQTAVFFFPAGVAFEWQSQFKSQTGLDLVVMEGVDPFDAAEFEHYRTLPHLAIGLSYELMSATKRTPKAQPGQPPPVKPLSRAEELVKLIEARGHKFTVTADEIQGLKNPKAPRTKFVLENIVRHPLCAVRWPMSGTPMRNYPRDMWAMFDFLQPGSMGSRSKFGTRYCDGHLGDYGWVDKGRTNEAELRDRLAHVMSRLTRKDVAQWLPTSDRAVVLCDMSASDLKKYQKHEAALGNAALSAMSGSDSSSALSAIKQLTALTVASKLDVMCERITEHVINRGVKMLVFAYNHETLKLAEQKYMAACPAPTPEALGHSYLAGGWMSPERRRREVDAWKAHQGGAVLFVNILASGVGIDLADAEVSLFLELAWVPADFLQAESRSQDIHLGKAVSKRLYEYLLTRKTIDEDMGRKLIEKLRGIDTIVGPGSESGELSQALGDSGLVDRNTLSLSSDSAEVVESVLAGLRARLFADDETPEVSDQSDNEDAEDTDDEPEAEKDDSPF